MNQAQEKDMLQALRSLAVALDMALGGPVSRVHAPSTTPHMDPNVRRTGLSALELAQGALERMEIRHAARATPCKLDLTPGEVAVLATEPQHMAMRMVRDRLGCSLREATNVIAGFQERNGRRGELHEHYPFPTAPCARVGCSGKARDASPGAEESLSYCSVECAMVGIPDGGGYG